MKKIVKIFNLVRERQLLSVLYERFWIFHWRAFRGATSLFFCKMRYPHFVVGKKARCWGSILVYMSLDSSITFGDHAWLVSDTSRSGITLYSRCKFRTFDRAEVVIGSNVSLNGTSITSRKRICIGDGTMVAPNVIIVDSDFHNIWPPDKRFSGEGFEKDQEVVIGKNVWIGMNSLVLKGVSIGDNSVIAAGSVVTSAIPSNVIAGGVPAKVIRSLS